MKTLRTTISRLQEASSQTRVTRKTPAPRPLLELELESLVHEMGRMTSDALYHGRPLQQAVDRIDGPSGMPLVGGASPPTDMAGVEILEGRFEHTNDRLVGVFDGQRTLGRGIAELSPALVYGLRADIQQNSFASVGTVHTLGKGRHRGMEPFPLLKDFRLAQQVALRLGELIFQDAEHCFEVQTGSSSRVVEALLR